MYGTDILVFNNVLDSTTTGSTYNESTGLLASGGTNIIISNNTMFLDSSAFSYGISLHSGVAIINNLICFASNHTSFGVFEANFSANSFALQNNLFYYAQTFYHDQNGWGDLTDIVDVNDFLKTTQLSSSIVSGNITIDPGFLDSNDSDFHLSIISPETVITGGIDLSSYFQFDRDGNPRTVPCSIGAYEKD